MKFWQKFMRNLVSGIASSNKVGWTKTYFLAQNPFLVFFIHFIHFLSHAAFFVTVAFCQCENRNRSDQPGLPSPKGFCNGFRESRKMTSWKPGVDMSTPVHPVGTPLNLVIVTIAFYVLWRNGASWGPKQNTATRLLFTDSKKSTLNCVEHVKNNRKRLNENYFLVS